MQRESADHDHEHDAFRTLVSERMHAMADCLELEIVAQL